MKGAQRGAVKYKGCNLVIWLRVGAMLRRAGTDHIAAAHKADPNGDDTDLTHGRTIGLRDGGRENRASSGEGTDA
jgi:hypothetical protein